MSADCTICYSSLHNGDQNLAIPCGHVYHEGCLKEWIKVSKTCPHCRRTVNVTNAVKLFFTNCTTNDNIAGVAENIIVNNDNDDDIEKCVEDVIIRLINLTSQIQEAKLINRNTAIGSSDFRARFMAIANAIQNASVDLRSISFKINESSQLYVVFDDKVLTAELLLKDVREQLANAVHELTGGA